MAICYFCKGEDNIKVEVVTGINILDRNSDIYNPICEECLVKTNWGIGHPITRPIGRPIEYDKEIKFWKVMDHLLEESAELIHAISKIKRFGPVSHAPNQHTIKTNMWQLIMELNDVKYQIAQLESLIFKPNHMELVSDDKINNYEFLWREHDPWLDEPLTEEEKKASNLKGKNVTKF